MNTKRIAFLLAFFLLFTLVSPVLAAKNSSPDNRYFIKSKANLWKNSLGVRHTFEGGFTADLSDWQLRLVKIFGLEYSRVSRMSILPSDTVPRKKSDLPSSQVSWGVALVQDSDAVQATGGKDVVIAVLDTGVATGHPDLESRIGDCQDFTNPKEPVVSGKCEDGNGHGTHVAGIIAADGGSDEAGMYGLAPEATLLAYKVCGDAGSCWADDVAAAIYAATDAGSDIINLSVGSDTEQSLVSDATAYAAEKGTLVIAAAGNDGSYTGSIDYPAAKEHVVAVGAIDENGEIPDWSSRGSNTESKEYVSEEGDIEFVAPGVNIESTWEDGSYAVLSGTSMAAPHVVGLAARLWDLEAENPAEAVIEELRKLSIEVLPEGDDDDSGFGLPILK